MRAARRHELKTNVLYARLSKWWAWAEAHKGLIFVCCLLLLGLGSILYLWIQRRVARPGEAWALLSTISTNEEQYRRLVEDYGSTRAGYEGRLLWASLLYERRLHAQARERLQHVLDAAGDNAYRGARALAGLATLAEQEHRVDEACRLYRTIVERYPAPGYVWLANERLRVLESPHRPVAPPLAFVALPVGEPETRTTTGPGSRPATRPTTDAAGAPPEHEEEDEEAED